MYRSPVLKKSIELLYMTPPWRTAIKLPWFKDHDDDWELTPDFVSNEEGYAFRPPVSFVAFAASAVSPFGQLSYIADRVYLQFRNALDCLVLGKEKTVPFSEAGYRPVYDELYEYIASDSRSPEFGEVVRDNIQALMSNVILTDLPR